MKKNIFFSLCAVIMLPDTMCHVDAKETLGKIIEHIMHREHAAFTRFDQEAFDIMKRDDAYGNEMEMIYNTSRPHHYKASIACSPEAQYTFNPLLELAQEDLNYCTRFLKTVKKYSSIIVSDKDIPEALLKTFFKKGSIVIKTKGPGVENLDALMLLCNELLHDTNEFTVVVTSLKGISPLVHKRLAELKKNILLFDLDILIDTLIDANQTLIDPARFYSLMHRNIVFVNTAALIEAKSEQRKSQYIHAIQVLNNFWYEPYIAESVETGPTFLDDYCKQVVYTQTNDATLSNKGINEAKSLIAFFALRSGDLDADDIIVKVTGRYYLENDSFIRLIEDNPVYEAFAMDDFLADQRTPYIDLYTGMFGLKYLYYNHMLNNINFEHMKEYRIWFEWIVGTYLYELAERHVPVKYIDSLGLNHYVFLDSVVDIARNATDIKRSV